MTGKKITVIGAGGIVGSHLTCHLGRMKGVSRVTVVDRDIYAARNVAFEDITPCNVGKPRALVQAHRLASINPGLRVEAIVGAVESSLLGWLRADLIVACLRSRRVLRCVNAMAFRLGVPWTAACISGEELVARVNVYLPGEDGACLECTWTDADYAALEPACACQEEGMEEPASAATPSALGALAASLQALECQKLLRGHPGKAASGWQITIDAGRHKSSVTAILRNPGCRFDHMSWDMAGMSGRWEELTPGRALEPGGKPRAPSKALRDQVDWSGARVCEITSRLGGWLRASERTFLGCGPTVVAAGFATRERLGAPLPA